MNTFDISLSLAGTLIRTLQLQALLPLFSCRHTPRTETRSSSQSDTPTVGFKFTMELPTTGTGQLSRGQISISEACYKVAPQMAKGCFRCTGHTFS